MTNEVVTLENKPLSVNEVKAQINIIQKVLQGVMKRDVHYGAVPGCGDKPTLLKPGAEKIMATFRLSADPIIDDLSTNDEIRYRVTVRLKSLNGNFVGSGIGECSTGEEKYKWRKSVCNEEFEEASEDRRREKWLKGYGNQKPRQLKQIRTQPSDLANTVLKMAKKRALVDAVLTATAASDIFDQDLEDLPEELRQSEINGKPTPQKPQPKEQPKELPKAEPIEEDKNFANEVMDELGVAETQFISVTQALEAMIGDTIHITGEVKGIYTKKVGIKKSDRTSYLIQDESTSMYVGMWGTPIEGIDKGMTAYFVGCVVSEYQGKKQFNAEQVRL